MPEKSNGNEAGDAGAAAAEEGRDVLEHVRQALRGLRYGEVRLIVQDGVVVQVDRLERRRLSPPPRRDR